MNWIHPSGAPALIAASRTIRAACLEHSFAAGWKLKIIGLRVFKQINDLNTVVDVGLVVGTIPQTTPTGSAIVVKPSDSSLSTIPTVFRSRKLFVIYSQANKFLIALSSTKPRPVSSTAAIARGPC